MNAGGIRSDENIITDILLGLEQVGRGDCAFAGTGVKSKKPKGPPSTANLNPNPDGA
jgi:hypothetical protein